VPPKKGRGGRIALIIGGVVLLVLCLCGVGAVFFFREVGNEIENQIDNLPSIAPTQPAGTPDAGSGNDDFNKGDCVTNEGTEADPELTKVTCAAGTFEVLAKVPFTTDKTQCDNDILGAGKGNYDSTYTYDETPGTLGDFVLCLKKR
jgi:hypothetical protein